MIDSIEASVDDITFVHLSDLHLADPNGERWLGLDTAQKLQSVLSEIHKLQLKPAFFVISGDLVNGPKPENYEALKTSLAAVEAFGVPVLLGLGNHDDRRFFRQIILEETAGSPTQTYFYSQIVQGLQIIVLDSKGGTGGTIEIDETQLSWLAEAIEQLAPNGKIIVLHHPPHPHRGASAVGPPGQPPPIGPDHTK